MARMPKRPDHGNAASEDLERAVTATDPAAIEGMIRAVAVFVEGGRSEAQRTVTTGRPPEAAEGVSRSLSPGGGIR